MPRNGAAVAESPVATVKLSASDRKYYSRMDETLKEVRKALLNAPDGDLVVTVEHRAK